MLLIIFACIIALFAVFVAVTFFMMMKDYKLVADKQNFRIHNVGSKLTVYLNDQVVIKDHSPDLIRGTEYTIKASNADYTVKCKSNKFGNVLSVQIFKEGQKIADNGKVIKEKTKTNK